MEETCAHQGPIVQLEHAEVRFGKTQVHRDISFSINAGEVVTILGPSGSGKTVLLKLMIGLLQPSAGRVTVLGQNLAELDEAELRHIRRQLGMLFQGAALFDSLSVFENIAYSLREFGDHTEDEIKATVEEKLSLIGLPQIAQKFPPQLSGGQKKRVGLARALASSPCIVLFDEPTTGLDPTAIRRIDDLIIQLRDEFKITSIVVTHDIESARRISDRWILLNKGVVLAQGPVEELARDNKDVRRFIEGAWSDDEAKHAK